MSDGLAIVLIVIYALYILFSLRQESPETEVREHSGAPTMKLPVALGLMAATTIGIVFMSELLVGTVEPVAEQWGLSELFIGVMLVPLVGNIAEHIVAVQVAYQNKMDLSLGIAIGSGLADRIVRHASAGLDQRAPGSPDDARLQQLRAGRVDRGRSDRGADLG